jgi:hypothetical protein
MLPPDIGFSGLGSVPFAETYDQAGNLFTGEERFSLYDDGFIAQDYVTTSLIEGGTDGLDRIPSPNTDGSSYFSYENPEQLDPDDSTALLFHRYASEAPDEIIEGSGSGSIGWEVNYTKFINRRRNIGLQVGFSFNGYDSRFNDSIDANLWVQEFRHHMLDGIDVPALPDPIENDDGTITQDPYTGFRTRGEEEVGDLISWIASEESEELLDGQAQVESLADFRSSLYNFRAGPTYNLSFNKYMGFQMGAGLSAVYFSGRFSAYEILMNPTGSENPSRGLTTTEEAEWQVGGYFDANAYYNIGERVSLFSGAQVQSGNSYTQFNEERHVDVDFDTQIFIHAGVGIKF